MILYTNGDSHTAAAEAVKPYAFASDDRMFWGMGREPHPDNIVVSYGVELANRFHASFHTNAESASSNDRIIRTTRQYLTEHNPDLIIIGWATWEREEWLHAGTYWQVNAGGVADDWPDAIKERYRDWITTVDYKQKEQEQHEKIWEFHTELGNRPHLFFNTFNHFDCSPRSWGNSYVSPYDPKSTYWHWLNAQGFPTVYPGSYHYGPDAHRAWAKFIYPLLTNLK